MMNYEQAKSELLRHAGLEEDFYHDGFVGCLRPYTGIKAGNFHAMVESVLTVGESISSSSHVERSVAAAVFTITNTARRYGVFEDGMLVRNQLIAPQDRMCLRRWIDIIEQMMLGMLHGHPPHRVIHAYCEYVAEFGWGENYQFFLPLLAAAIESDDVGCDLAGYCQAIIALGSSASSLANTLLQARERKWAWYEPHERCEVETRRCIDLALAAVRPLNG